LNIVPSYTRRAGIYFIAHSAVVCFAFNNASNRSNFQDAAIGCVESRSGWYIDKAARER
jgi:hypothetical protein